MDNGKRSIVGWVITNGLWWGSAIAGTVYNEHPFLNVFRCFTLFLVFAWFCACLGRAATERMTEKKANFNRTIPGWITFTSDLSLAILVIAYGHWIYGILVIVQQYFEQVFYYSTERTTIND